MQVTIQQAKTQLSKLIASAKRSKEIIIVWRDKPVMRLSMIGEYSGKTRIGGLKRKKFKMAAKFDNPMPDAEIARTFNDS
jgi:antitoxin (DNA-binding transcriptional repressor) of toxin-antitoxin stability system